MMMCHEVMTHGGGGGGGGGAEGGLLTLDIISCQFSILCFCESWLLTVTQFSLRNQTSPLGAEV